MYIYMCIRTRLAEKEDLNEIEESMLKNGGEWVVLDDNCFRSNLSSWGIMASLFLFHTSPFHTSKRKWVSY